MLNWSETSPDNFEAYALQGLLLCVVMQDEQENWIYDIWGVKDNNKGADPFDTAAQAQTACERALAGLLWPQFNQLSIILRIDQVGNLLEALTEIDGRVPGPDFGFIEQRITSNVPPSISIAAEYGDTLVSLGQIKDCHAFRALYHNSAAKDWQPGV